MSNSEITFSDCLHFFFKMVGRCLGFATMGAICIGLWGALLGIWIGAVAALFLVPDEMLVFGVMRATIGAVIGAIGGAFTFLIVALLSYQTLHPDAVFHFAVSRAMKPGFYGLLIGGVACATNAIAYYAITDNGPSPGTTAWAFWGFCYGVMAGYPLGIFYGAIKGALFEIKRQRGETSVKS
jgi:hypothetical protein